MSTSIRDLDRGFRRLVGRLRREAKRADVSVGWFRTARHESGAATAEIATHHEFGAPKANIPARPMLRRAVDENRLVYAQAYRDAWGRAVDGTELIERALLRFANRVRNDVVDIITNDGHAPLAPATIERKGSSKPLIDTGTMRDQIEARIA